MANRRYDKEFVENLSPELKEIYDELVATSGFGLPKTNLDNEGLFSILSFVKHVKELDDKETD